MIALIALWGFPAFGETLELGAEDAWPPYSNPDGTGMANDIVKAAYQAVGIGVVFNVRPYKRLEAEAKHGKFVGIFSVTRDASKEREFLWGNELLFVSQALYYHHKDRPINAKAVDELRQGERIGVILGYPYGEAFDRNDRIVKEWVRSYEQNIDKLLANRLDAIVMNDKGAKKLLAEMRLTDQIVPAFPGMSSPQYVAFSKEHPRAEHYAKKLDEGLRIIKANGVYDRILKRY